jgi:hypothetical protein
LTGEKSKTMTDSEVSSARSMEGRFDEEAYLYEGDGTRRMRLAERYYSESENVWVALYSQLAKHLNQEKEVIRQEVEKRITHSLEAPQDISDVAKGMFKLKEFLQISDRFRERFSDQPDVLSKGLKDLWNVKRPEIYTLFGLGTDISTPIQETLRWFDDLLLNNQVMVFSLPSEKTDGYQKIEKFIRSAGAPLLMKGNQTLLLFPDMLGSQFSGLDFLAGLSHERGHFLRNESLKNQGSDGEVSLEMEARGFIFSEFFSMLEQWRTYALANDEELSTIKSPHFRNAFIVSEDKNNAEVGGKIPFLGPETTFLFTPAYKALFLAFGHGLAQISEEGTLIKAVVNNVDQIDWGFKKRGIDT